MRGHDAARLADSKRGAGRGEETPLQAVDGSTRHTTEAQATIRDGDGGKQQPASGSADPHGTGDMPTAKAKKVRWSDRAMEEPESPAALRVEPLPAVNVPEHTTWRQPPAKRVEPAFTPETPDDVLSPAWYQVASRHIASVNACSAAAARGDLHGAKRLRPTPELVPPEVALRPEAQVYGSDGELEVWDFTQCKHGGRPRLLQPSSWPDDPPASDLNVPAVLHAAGAAGVESSLYGKVFPDQAEISQMAHGHEARSTCARTAVLDGPHVGALENADGLRACLDKERKKGFCVSGYTEFPPYYPIRALAYNVVVQKEKLRLCIDPTIDRFPDDDVGAVNDCDSDDECPVTFVRFTQFTRAGAILQTAGVAVRPWARDFSSYYCKSPIQRADAWMWARVVEVLKGAAAARAAERAGLTLTEGERVGGFEYNPRVMFGGRRWPGNLTRQSNFIAWCARIEFKRYDAEHPSTVPRVLEWLAMRTGLIPPGGATGDDDFQWAVMFFLMIFIDDAGYVGYADALWTDASRTARVCDEHGTPMLRCEKHFEIFGKIAERFGHECPLDKDQAPRDCIRHIDLLGRRAEFSARRRSVLPAKRKQYAALIKRVLESARAEYGAFNRLVHKLLHAAEETPGMRRKLQSMWRAMRVARDGANRLRGKAVVINGQVANDLRWCHEALTCTEAPYMPLASRTSFIGVGKDDLLVHYGDASLAPDKPTDVSGFGAWSVYEETVFVIFGEWEPWEAAYFNINELELHTMNMALVTFMACRASCGGTRVKHALEFTDNEAAEGASRAAISKAVVFDAMLEARDSFQRAHGLFCESERITSRANLWADALSRGAVQATLHEMDEAGLRVEVVEVEATWRDMSAYRLR